MHIYRQDDLAGLSTETSYMRSSKRPVLCLTVGNASYKLATFNNENCQLIFEAFLRGIYSGEAIGDALLSMKTEQERLIDEQGHRGDTKE